MLTLTEIIAHIDGGSRGNPGPAAYGVAIETPQGQPVTGFGKYIGKTTNNVAEYQGLLAALEYALNNAHPRLRVLTDSELMAHQINGRYKVRSPDLKPLFDKAKGLISRLESFSIRHVYREQNREADRLANEAMDDAASGRAPRAAAPPAPAAVVAPPPAAAAIAPRPSTPATPPPQISKPAPPKSHAIAATFENGVLHPHTQLPLFDGEEVELEIRRKK
jgi:probable phosphoglycerate mutase